MKDLKYLLMMIFFTLFLSCSEDKIIEPDPTPIESVVISEFPADTGRTGQFTFFSFKEGKIVPREDSATTKWDIAFQATTIITNSGYRGPAQGGAVVLRNTDFATLKEAPSEGYEIEQESKFAIPTGSGNGWYNYDPQAMVIRPIPGVVLVIRTADGKYAKMRILNYYKGAPENITQEVISRFYKFEYVYQSDGSRSFEKK